MQPEGGKGCGLGYRLCRGPQDSQGQGLAFLRLPVTTNTAKWVLPLPFSGLSFPVGGGQPSWALALDSGKHSLSSDAQ